MIVFFDIIDHLFDSITVSYYTRTQSFPVKQHLPCHWSQSNHLVYQPKTTMWLDRELTIYQSRSLASCVHHSKVDNKHSSILSNINNRHIIRHIKTVMSGQEFLASHVIAKNNISYILTPSRIVVPKPLLRWPQILLEIHMGIRWHLYVMEQDLKSVF